MQKWNRSPSSELGEQPIRGRYFSCDETRIDASVQQMYFSIECQFVIKEYLLFMRILASVILSLVITGCAATGPQLVQRTDPYTKESTYTYGPINADFCPGAAYDGSSVQVSFLDDGSTSAMVVDLIAHEWAFLIPAAPLDMLVDGRAIQLTSLNGTSRTVQGMGLIKESLFYPVNKQIVSHLASAKKVQFRVLGGKRSIERCLDADALSKVGQIVPLVVDRPAASRSR